MLRLLLTYSVYNNQNKALLKAIKVITVYIAPNILLATQFSPITSSLLATFITISKPLILVSRAFEKIYTRLAYSQLIGYLFYSILSLFLDSFGQLCFLPYNSYAYNSYPSIAFIASTYARLLLDSYQEFTLYTNEDIYSILFLAFLFQSINFLSIFLVLNTVFYNRAAILKTLYLPAEKVPTL